MDKDVQFQIECLSAELAAMLMEEYGWGIKQALDNLFTSETYRKLNDPSSGLYYESAVYVFCYLKNEIEKGVSM